jgi:hypothetical protein
MQRLDDLGIRLARSIEAGTGVPFSSVVAGVLAGSPTAASAGRVYVNIS